MAVAGGAGCAVEAGDAGGVVDGVGAGKLFHHLLSLALTISGCPSRLSRDAKEPQRKRSTTLSTSPVSPPQVMSEISPSVELTVPLAFFVSPVNASVFRSFDRAVDRAAGRSVCRFDVMIPTGWQCQLYRIGRQRFPLLFSVVCLTSEFQDQLIGWLTDRWDLFCSKFD